MSAALVTPEIISTFGLASFQQRLAKAITHLHKNAATVAIVFPASTV
ncbi:MAG: hypothetical protein HY046_12855 [Acidobacteria bacterium]|nr:hypothetical protein [Acidobacteriota bacterium]